MSDVEGAVRAGAMIVTAAAAALMLAACDSGGSPTATSSSAAPSASSTSASASPTPASTTPTASASASGSPTPSGPGGVVAAFQLCGTALALSAGWIGQVSAEQLAEGRNAYADARDAYTDDGSGLLQKADAVVAAVDAQDTPSVITTAKDLGAACREFNPGT